MVQLLLLGLSQLFIKEILNVGILENVNSNVIIT